MSKQRLIVMPTSNLSFWILASWYLNVSSIIIACLCVGCISLTFFSTSFSMEYWILDEITVKKIYTKYKSWFLFKEALNIAPLFPEAATQWPLSSPFFFLLLLLLLLLLLILLLCLLSGGQPQSNTTVSGSVGMQSADEPKVPTSAVCCFVPTRASLIRKVHYYSVLSSLYNQMVKTLNWLCFCSCSHCSKKVLLSYSRHDKMF